MNDKYSFFEGNDISEKCANCRKLYDELFQENQRLKNDLLITKLKTEDDIYERK